ncbi:G-alpha-domain-containing protein [Salix suchowensis]|nr:G-alpha-domain-containing protein [Salix suchowensis]
MEKPRYQETFRARASSDPLSAALAPPPGETLEQKELRLKAEAEAKRISDGIDDMIRQERHDRKRGRAEVKVLLLGQSESGKSTTLKLSNYERYRERLEPLVELEDRLIRLLSSAEEDEATHLPPSLSVHNGHTNGWSNGRNLPAIVIPQGLRLGGKSKSPKTAHSGEIEGWWEDPDDPVHALHASAPAMLELWRDPQVTARLREKRLRLEESSGLCVFCPIHRLLINALCNFSYLDEIARITAKMYIPTDGTNRGVRWKIYDVGGARNQRQAWAPYFEDGTLLDHQSRSYVVIDFSVGQVGCWRKA